MTGDPRLPPLGAVVPRGPRLRGSRLRRRDRHGRGLRGMLAPPGLPLHRTRSQRFDDLVLQAVARLESRWQPQLAGVEFAVEEIPPVAGDGPGHPEVPLARLEPGSEPGSSSAQVPAAGDLLAAGRAEAAAGRPPRIVVYRRPLLARADDEEELADLVLDVVVEQVAELLGLDPEDVDPGYGESG